MFSGFLFGEMSGRLLSPTNERPEDRPRVPMPSGAAPFAGRQDITTPAAMSKVTATPTSTTSLPQPPDEPAEIDETLLSRNEPSTETVTGAHQNEMSVVPQTTAASTMGLPANQPKRPATRLVIPKLGVDAPVVVVTLREGIWQVDQLTQEVGHLQGTASPGDPSNVAIAGHVTLTGGKDGPFRHLSQLRKGDEVLVFTQEQEYRYLVREVRVVSPEDVQVTFPTTEPILTLITCINWNHDRRVYDERIIAVAELTS